MVAMRAAAFMKNGRISQPERQMIELLTHWEIPFERQVPSGRWILDFVLPQHLTVIEVHGSYWHDQPKYQERDQRKRKELEEQGWKVIFARSDRTHLWFTLLESIQARPSLSTT